MKGKDVSRKLDELFARREQAHGYQPPAPMHLELKRDFRVQALAEGRCPKPYTPEQILELYAEDVATVEGRGWIAEYIDEPGWKTEEGRELIQEWQEASRENLERLATLPEEEWWRVYHDEDVEAAMELKAMGEGGDFFLVFS